MCAGCRDLEGWETGNLENSVTAVYPIEEDQEEDFDWRVDIVMGKKIMRRGARLKMLSLERLECSNSFLTVFHLILQGHDLSADYWSLGILMFELLTGR